MSSPDPAEQKTDAILAVRLPADLRDELRTEAEANQRSMSGQIRWLIERSLHGDEPTGTAVPRGDERHRSAA